MPDVPAKPQDDALSLPAMPKGGADEAAAPRPTAGAPDVRREADSARAQRNPIFSDLVQDEEDLPGLVGYALYKLSKRDWLAAFAETHGREPTQEEIDSYILGEHTQRRLATYRRLAEELIERKTPVAEKPMPRAAAVLETPPQRGTAGHSLRSSLASEAKDGADARFSPDKTMTNVKPHRSGATTVIFWILVLVVLVGVAWLYVNHPSLLRTLTG